MDRIEKFQSKYIAQANEGISDVGMMLGGAAVMIGTLKILWHITKKKNNSEKAKSQRAYFELHEIPLEQRNAYGKKIVSDVKANFENAMKQVIANKKKSGLDKVEEAVIDEIQSYINDNSEIGNSKADFDRNNVKIKYDITPQKADYGAYSYLMSASYSGNGFIPEDNLYEIPMYAIRPIVVKIVNALREQYAEEIRCKLVEIKIDAELASVTISEP